MSIPQRYRRPYKPRGLSNENINQIPAHPSGNNHAPATPVSPASNHGKNSHLPNQHHIDMLLAATSPATLSKTSPVNVSGLGITTPNSHRQSTTSSLNSMDSFYSIKSSMSTSTAASASTPTKSPTNAVTVGINDFSYRVNIKTGSRMIAKQIDTRMRIGDLNKLLLREHRLELDFDDNNIDDLVLWECVDNTRRPLRAGETVNDLINLHKGTNTFYLEPTSTSLRVNPDSLASLVPRRDMLRTPPIISHETCSFTVPPKNYKLTNLQTLVWAEGIINLKSNHLTVTQRVDSRPVCAASLGDTDIYELMMGDGPEQFTCIIRLHANGNRPILISTNNLKLFSILRNAVFTARSRQIAARKR